MKTLPLLIFISLFANNSHAIPPKTPKRIRVVKYSRENTGTIFGLRLNEGVDQAQKREALDADFDCNYVDHDYRIILCRDGYCDPINGPLFYEFDDPTSCLETQKKLKKMVNHTGGACLFIGKIHTNTWPHTVTTVKVLEEWYCN